MDIKTKRAVQDFAHRWRTSLQNVDRVMNENGLAFSLRVGNKTIAGISEKTYNENKEEIDNIFKEEAKKNKPEILKDSRMTRTKEEYEKAERIMNARKKEEASIDYSED